MKLMRTIVLLIAASAAGLCQRQVCCAQPVPPLSESRIDVHTRWAFRAISPVKVSSQIIRLGDVVTPVDSNIAAWQRLRRSPIGLLPVNGTSMAIDRTRLEKVIRNAEATPLAIDWIGPQKITVSYDPSLAQPVSPAMQPSISRVTQAGYDSTRSMTPPPVPGRLPHKVTPLPTAEAKIIVNWINTAIDRQHGFIRESFDIEIDLRQSELVALRALATIPEIRILDDVADGRCRLHVIGRNVDGPCESVIHTELIPFPVVIFPQKSLQRGHRISARDLVGQPVPRSKFDDSMVTDPSELIGQEVFTSLRTNRPISRDSVGPPIVIRRGDLLDIRVVGGGVSVTTRGKASDDGALSDTIEVETLTPRKRLLARVVASGLVEIVTRPPRISQ